MIITHLNRTKVKNLIIESVGWANETSGTGAPSGSGWQGPMKKTEVETAIGGTSNESDYDLYHDSSAGRIGFY